MSDDKELHNTCREHSEMMSRERRAAIDALETLQRKHEALVVAARDVCELEPDLKILSMLRKLVRGRRR